MRQEVINSILPLLIPEIASKNCVHRSNVIDLFSEMGGSKLNMPELFPDKIHCNEKRYLKMA